MMTFGLPIGSSAYFILFFIYFLSLSPISRTVNADNIVPVRLPIRLPDAGFSYHPLPVQSCEFQSPLLSGATGTFFSFQTGTLPNKLLCSYVRQFSPCPPICCTSRISRRYNKPPRARPYLLEEGLLISRVFVRAGQIYLKPLVRPGSRTTQNQSIDADFGQYSWPTERSELFSFPEEIMQRGALCCSIFCRFSLAQFAHQNSTANSSKTEASAANIFQV